MSQRNLPFEYNRGICYSGFRDGQQPGVSYPSYAQVLEDLRLLEPNWKYLRMYDCDPHSEMVLKVIQNEGMNLKIMLGAYIVAEMNNHACPWGASNFSEDQLNRNHDYNNSRITKVIEFANNYPKIICAVSAGNESCVDWSGNYVSVNRVIDFVKRIKSNITQPVTFCDNYVPWLNKLKPLAEVVDFISIHTYPVWEYKNIHESIGYTKDNYYSVANMYPDKPTVITEAGWATNSNGRGINTDNVNEDFQKIYYNDLMEWTDKEEILTFFFEAFDEPWKGSAEPMEPEKHWGVFKEDRTPKKVVQDLLTN